MHASKSLANVDLSILPVVLTLNLRLLGPNTETLDSADIVRDGDVLRATQFRAGLPRSRDVENQNRSRGPARTSP